MRNVPLGMTLWLFQFQILHMWLTHVDIHLESTDFPTVESPASSSEVVKASHSFTPKSLILRHCERSDYLFLAILAIDGVYETNFPILTIFFRFFKVKVI